MIATHLVKVSYYVNEKCDIDGIILMEMAKWKALLADALENIEVENLGDLNGKKNIDRTGRKDNGTD